MVRSHVASRYYTIVDQCLSYIKYDIANSR